MPIPAGVTRISLQGAFTSGDIFDTSLWVRGAAITSDATANLFANAVAGLWSGQKLGFTNMLDNGSTYQGVKVYHYPTGGPTATYVGAAALLGGAGTGSGHQPHQACICVTTQTAFSGRSKRGRMYLPATGINLDGGLQMTLSVLAADMVLVGGYVEGLKTISIPATPVVVSTKLGTTSDITQLKTDTLPDIQRRRANKATISGVVITPIP